MALLNICRNNFGNLVRNQIDRSVSTTSVAYLKNIKVDKVENNLEISGEYVPSPREHLVLKEVIEPGKKFCPKCTLGLDLKHTDVLIISQYLRSDGSMLPRAITGLCNVQQKYIGTLVTMAHKAGLMPNVAPKNSKRDPTKRKDWKKFNTYFDETTVRYAMRPIAPKEPCSSK